MPRRMNFWLLLVVVLCAISIWAGRSGWLVLPAADPTPETTTRTGREIEPPTALAHLLILNGTDRSHLARDVGFLVVGVGCVAERLGNAPPGPHPESLLINRRLEAGRADDLAHSLGGVPVLTEWDDRGTEDAVLLLGDDYRIVMDALER